MHDQFHSISSRCTSKQLPSDSLCRHLLLYVNLTMVWQSVSSSLAVCQSNHGLKVCVIISCCRCTSIKPWSVSSNLAAHQSNHGLCHHILLHVNLPTVWHWVSSPLAARQSNHCLTVCHHLLLTVLPQSDSLCHHLLLYFRITIVWQTVLSLAVWKYVEPVYCKYTKNTV